MFANIRKFCNNNNMIECDFSEEIFEQCLDELFSILIKENEQSVPSNLTKEEKIWMVKNLILISSNVNYEKCFLDLQNKVLSYINKMNVIEFKNFKCSKDYNQKIFDVNADMILIFCENLFGNVSKGITDPSNIPQVQGGVQINANLTKLLKQDSMIASYKKPYCVEAGNLPAKYLSKILIKKENFNLDFIQSIKELSDFVRQKEIKKLCLVFENIEDEKIKNQIKKLSLKIFKKQKIKIIY